MAQKTLHLYQCESCKAVYVIDDDDDVYCRKCDDEHNQEFLAATVCEVTP